MSKRHIFPQQYGERKKAKLDVTVSDHNFPLSQSSGAGKDGNQANTWGDDNDDEILLLASQACEDAYISELPDYSMCMQPPSTSTQMNEPMPSTSKTAFHFKKPTSSPLSMITTKLRDKCATISSPLPGMSKVCKMDGINVSDDIIINDNLYKGQDSDHVYRQLLKLQEENAKLKSENGKLLEKCVTKEGEASILRTQLKTSQIAVDNARLEKVKVQERVQMEWSDKLATVNNQMHDLRTQLDFKNLEIISIKEKCKMLESKKVKLTQVTVSGNDISMSQRHNNHYTGHEPMTPRNKLKTTSSGVQTDGKSHFIQLNVPMREDTSKLSQILPIIMKPTTAQCSILDYNEKLRQPTETNKCRIYSTLHRLPTTPRVCKQRTRKKTQLNCIYGSLSKMAGHCDRVEDILEIFKITKGLLEDVLCELEIVSQRMTTAFQREMDEKYIEVTSNLLVVDKQDLLSPCALYKEEQAILTRRMTTVLVNILEDSRREEFFNNLLGEEDSRRQTDFVNIVNRICTILDNTTCALLYSGILLSLTLLLKKLISTTSTNKPILEIIKTIILSRPMPFVTCEVLKLLVEFSGKSVKEVCCRGIVGNLKVDYDQGVLLYRRDSCTLQVLLKQIEAALKCAEKQGIVEVSIDITRSLMLLYSSRSCHTDSQQEKDRCDCQLVLMQLLVYGLNICANLLNSDTCIDDIVQTDIKALCRSGVQTLYQCALRDVEFVSRLGHNEGQLLELCETLRGVEQTDIYKSMLSEITSTFQSTHEDLPTTYHKEAWLGSFQNFTITD